MTQEQATLEGDLLLVEHDYVRATATKRFVNYLVDLIIFYVIVFLIAILMAIVAPTALDTISEDNPGINLLDRLLSLLLYAIYMGIVEALFKGKSIGKFITRTRAVNLDGSRISAQTAFSRGFCRAVPFSAFSAFGTPSNPWQDRWTNTMVIDESSN